jgi:hypothetical protein
MNDERLEQDLRAALLRDDPGPARHGLRVRISAVPDEAVQPRGFIRLPSLSRLVTFAAAVAAVAIVGSTIVIAVSLRGPAVGPALASPSASSSPHVGPSVTPTLSPAPTASPTPAGSPAPTMNAAGFSTTGLTTGWKGFSWSQLASDSPLITSGGLGSGVSQVLHWRGGYVASGSASDHSWPSMGLWTSPDGETWTPVTSIDEPGVLVSAAPGGLIAVGVDPATLVTGSVWTSSDGKDWRNAGAPNLPGSILSIAGTDAGIVATVDVVTGTGKSATGTYLVEFSTDGVNWSPEPINTGGTGNGFTSTSSSDPHVQAGNGRFFLMGTAGPTAPSSSTGFVLTSSAVAKDEMWWSDDGRTWTHCGGSYTAFASYIDFGRDGLLLHTASNAIPGGVGQAVSIDGGKTWRPNDGFVPLGVASCTGECSVGPDGVIGSNGTIFVAVKNGGKKAWVSYDGNTWTPIAWTGSDPSSAGFGGFLVLPRGVVIGSTYGAAR